MAKIDFQAKWNKMDWHQRADVLYARAHAFWCIGDINNLYVLLQKALRKHSNITYIRKDIKTKLDILEACEFKLQKLWGVKKDKNYHTYWMAPKACTCPKMDNMDRLGYGRIIAGDCPLHGSHPCWKTKGK